MQNTQFGVARGGCLGKQVAEHIGGYRAPYGSKETTQRDE
jgi:hypothetical protein